MNIFAGLDLLIPKWEIVSSRKLTKGERNSIAKAIVVDSKYGQSIEFQLKTGKSTYMPIHGGDYYPVGKKVNLRKIQILHLHSDHYDGNPDLWRVQI